MKKYKVEVTQTVTGYVEVFADNEDQAEQNLAKHGLLRGQMTIDSEDYEVDSVKELTEQYKCQSYAEDGKIIDCTCGKCTI